MKYLFAMLPLILLPTIVISAPATLHIVPPGPSLFHPSPTGVITNSVSNPPLTKSSLLSYISSSSLSQTLVTHLPPSLPSPNLFTPPPQNAVLINCQGCDLTSPPLKDLLFSPHLITVETNILPVPTKQNNQRRGRRKLSSSNCASVREVNLSPDSSPSTLTEILTSAKPQVVYLLVTPPLSSDGSINRRRLEGDDDAGNDFDDDGYGGYADDDSSSEVDYSQMMFKIQYTQLVLWTTLSVLAAAVYCVYLMMVMPMFEDTLLYGGFMSVMGGMEWGGGGGGGTKKFI